VVGILAYGSLLVDPGWEIEDVTERKIEGIQTPFGVEYAYKSRGRAYAPTLVPVPDGKGARVCAQVFILNPATGDQEAKDILYRREINRVGDQDKVYDETAQSQKRNPVLVRSLADLAGIPLVLYTYLDANLGAILRADISADDKAEKLARLAVESVTEETFARCRDGIRYLADAIAHGIRTPLTEAYRAAVLRCADDAPDLETVRQRIARKKDWVPEEHV
jgi:hypothetical protein